MTSGTSFTVVIPARYESRWLPGKALRDIAAKLLIQHVYERACESGAGRVIIATDVAASKTLRIALKRRYA